MINAIQKTNRWNDGRSGDAGRVAGNLVLDHMDPSRDRIQHEKGTVFVDAQKCWVGRVVADDGYLSTGVAHWANISADQQRQLMRDAEANKRKLFYLFITAHAKTKTVRYWEVAAEVVDRELLRRGKNGPGDVLGLHISIRDERYFLGEEDVTDSLVEFTVGSSAADVLRSAVDADRSKKSIRPSRNESPKSSETTAHFRRFDIPISDGRVATLHAPVPMSKSDIARIKSYIDVVSDLLT